MRVPTVHLSDADCVSFLQWALPRMGYRWAGFRKVRRQVRRRLKGRLRELGLSDLDRYRLLLEASEPEWSELDACCRITISRFYRDCHVFDVLAEETLPRLAACTGTAPLRIWSAGCGAGEEPYTLALIMRHAEPSSLHDVSTELVATDLDSQQLERARRAVYPQSSLLDLPDNWRRTEFSRTVDDEYLLRPAIRSAVMFEPQDLRREAPGGRFHLILCRNLAFTYFDSELQRQVLSRLVEKLVEPGVLVVGAHEKLPDGLGRFEPSPEELSILWLEAPRSMGTP